MEKIGKYKIVEMIGKGGMGVVYKALDPRIGRVVAIKTLFAHRDAEPEVRHRFLQEARSAGALSHKNIITIFEMDEDAGQSFIAMEYLEGEDLKSIIARRAPISLEQKLHILLEVCEGVAHAHSMGVIHRDIKPGNIFLTRNGQIKILDFGLARVSSSELTQTQTSMGTPSYMSPEQVRGEKLDHRTDIFSVGVVAYELLTYTKPFQAETDFGLAFKITYAEPEPVERVNPLIPIEISSMITGLLEKDKEKRYQHAEDLVRELESVQGLLEERKRALRVEVRAAVAKLESLVSANRSLSGDVAEKLEDMKQAAPEFFEATILTQSGRSSGRQRSVQLEYLDLIEFRDRTLREFDRVSGLLERRQKRGPMVQEAENLREAGDFEGALQIIDSILRDDPSFGPATALRKEISTRLEAQQRELERVRLIADLLEKGRELFGTGDLVGCQGALERVFTLQPDHPEALALNASLQERLAEQREIEERRRRAEDALGRAREALLGGQFQESRSELERALTEWPDLPGSGELKARIEQAEWEAEARAAREALVRGLWAEASALDHSGQEDEALSRLGQLLELEPDHTGGLELRAEIGRRRTRRQQIHVLLQESAGYIGQDRLVAARAVLEKALQLEPSHADAIALLEQVKSTLAEQELAERKRRLAQGALERARKALAAGQIASAREELSAALKTFPDMEGADSLTVEIDHAEEQERLRLEKEREINGLLEQSRACREAGAHGEALDALARLLELQPGHREAVRLKREIESSLRTAELAEQRRRERNTSLLHRARDAAARGEYENALAQARALDADAQAQPEVSDLIAVWQAELVARREMEEKQRQKIDRLLDAARRLMEAGAFPEARKPLQEVLDLQLDHPEALRLLHEVQLGAEAERLRQAKAEEGRKQKQQGLRLLSEKKHRASLTALLRASELLGEDPDLRVAIEEAEAEVRAEDARLKIEAGLIEARRLFTAEFYDAALSATHDVLKLEPQHPEARELLSKIEKALEKERIRTRIAELLAQARQALAARDLDAASRLSSEILVLDGQNPDARELLKRVEETQFEKSRRLEIAALLAQSSQALASGDFKQAAVRAREVLLLDEQNADARELLQRIDQAQEAGHRHEQIAALLLQSRQEHGRGDLESALTHAGEILRLDPSHKEARVLQRDLEKEIRTRQKEQERDRKRQALEEQRARKAAADATVILPKRTGPAAWIRSPLVIAAAAVILAAATYLAVLRPTGGAELVVLSEPDGVEVLLNGRPVGITSSGNLALRNLPTGPGTLTATKEGFSTFSRGLDLTKGKNPDLTVKLVPADAELRIRTDQPDVSVQLDGIEIGRTSDAGALQVFKVKGGQHTVSLIKEGFAVQSKDLGFTPGQTVLVDENLQPLSVKVDSSVLRILTNPADADVYLDGKRVGITAGGSLILQDLKPGSVSLLLKKNGYADAQKDLTLVAGRALDHVVNLSARPASLVLATNTPGAEVWVDNTARGKTDSAGNLTLNDLPPESRIIKVAKDGFQEKTDILNLRPGETRRLQLSLMPVVARPALLSVSTLPDKADVYVDDEFKGTTPLNGLRIDPGTRKIRVRKEGYRDAERSVELRAGEPRAESIPLEMLKGILQFNIQPEGASARIGTQTFDPARQRQIELEPGTYTVELSATGYKPGQKTVTIQGGQTTQLQAVLDVVATAATTGYAEAFLSLDSWDHPSGWQADGLLHAAGRGTAVLKDRVYENFSQRFQLRLNKGVTASWIIRWQDEKNYCLIQIHSDRHPEKTHRNTIYFSTYRDGKQIAVLPVPLPFPFGRNRSEWVDIQMDVTGNLIVARVNVTTGTTVSRTEMGRYTIPAGSPARGRLGFAVYEDEEYDVSSLVIDPVPRNPDRPVPGNSPRPAAHQRGSR